MPYLLYIAIAACAVLLWRIVIHIANRVRVREANRTGLSPDFDPEE